MRRKGSLLNWHFVLRVLGFILCVESFFLALSGLVAYLYQSWDVGYLLFSGGLSLFIGILLLCFNTKKQARNIGKRESILAVALSWFTFSLFGMIPFYMSGVVGSVTDAFFETMSGLTTTGSSVLTNIDDLPKGIQFWRCLLQWLGGMGMILFSLALLPLLGGEAIQLYDAETTGITHDKFRPRVGQVAKRLWGIYLGLTLLLGVLLYLGPMDMFDAMCHAFSSVSTGGYSTRQASIAYWDSMYVNYVITLFMIMGSVNFTLFYFLFKGNFGRIRKDEELRWYLVVIFSLTLVVSIYLACKGYFGSYGESLHATIFQIVSVISTTGFTTVNYVSWESFYWIVFLLMMVVCGCAGSTSGGMKMIRLVVLAKNTNNEFKKQLHPRAIIPVRVNGAALSNDVVQRVMSFVFLYISIILFSWLFLALMGMEFDDALGASISSLSNAGLGLGQTGMSGTLAHAPDICKWYMSFLMIVGRLELFTILILFTPGFWKKM